MTLTAHVLGPLRLAADGMAVDLGGPRQRRLFGALLVGHGAVISSDHLIESTFRGDPPAGARRTFRTYVARLRRALEAAGIESSKLIATAASGYQIPPGVLLVDSVEFESGLADAQEQLDAGDAEQAVMISEQALGLWSGSAYDEFADEEWAAAEAMRLTELRTVTREIRSEAMLESGRHSAAVAELEALIEEEPFREEPRRLLMVALYRCGRHADALRAARRYRQFLAEVTGLEPSCELIELEQLIIDRDPRLEARPRGRRLHGYLFGPAVAESELGITFQARQPSIDRTVAITAIPPEQAGDPEFRRQFEIHARRVASIEHPNVVPLYHYWSEPGGHAYLVTRFLAGGSLAQRLAERPPGVDERLRILREVGDGLAAAHDCGITHGQLDASWVLFDDAGTAYLTGFALPSDPHDVREDITALQRLTAVLWAAPSADSGMAGDEAAITARVVSVVERADELSPFATIDDLITAVEEAVRASVVAFDLPEMAGDARSPARRMNLPC